MSDDPTNLDYFCAEMAFKLVEMYKAGDLKEAASHVQRSMGVLQEDGLYAYGIYQTYRKDKGGVLANLLNNFFADHRVHSLFASEPELSQPSPGLQVLLMGLTRQPLDRLFLGKDLIMRILVYAYYHLRAKIKED